MKNTLLFALAIFLLSCGSSETKEKDTDKVTVNNEVKTDIDKKLEKYVEVTLTSDVSNLTNNQKEVIKRLIEVAKIMDDIFWMEAYGERDSLYNILTDKETKLFVDINYGPWDRLDGNKPFVDGVGEKPKGANFYPQNMTKEEFNQSALSDKASLYTLLRRDSNNTLITVPYRIAFEKQVKLAAEKLLEASNYAENESLKYYLLSRAEAFLTDEYDKSDVAWMDLKNNQIDIICGPIETYEDQLFGYKAAHEAYVLIKDLEWSKRLEKYASMLPELQRNLPVEDKFKKETPGTDSQLAAFDVIYYAGDCNAGSKTIAVNLPNDEEIQLKKGTRRSQLKNAMRAKFEKILVPISKELIDESQQEFINFDAFFANTMFHEVAHGLGIKRTIDNKRTVREALKEHSSAIEEGKADILGLYMITQLHEKGEIEGELKSYYTTFMASIFRSIRFGTSSAHGKANMIRFNFFKNEGVFVRSENGKYKIDFDKMNDAMNKLSAKILRLQGEGNYDEVANLVSTETIIGAELAEDLKRLTEKEIPVDVIFNQGIDVLGL